MACSQLSMRTRARVAGLRIVVGIVPFFLHGLEGVGEDEKPVRKIPGRRVLAGIRTDPVFQRAIDCTQAGELRTCAVDPTSKSAHSRAKVWNSA